MGVIRPGNYPNGKCIETNGCYVWIPNNIGNSASATIYNPGQGMTYEALNRLYTPLVTQGVDQIVVVPKYDYYMYGTNSYINASNRSMQAIYNTCNQNGITLTGINTVGSSAGDRYALVEFVQACKNGTDNGYCVITGASTIRGASQYGQPFHGSGNNSPNHAFLTDSDYEVIRGKTVYVFEGKNGEKMSYVEALVRHGVNVVLVECKSNGHDQLSWNPLNSNIFNLLDGNPDTFLKDSNYSFWKCVDPVNMTWVRLSEEELREVCSSNYMETLLKKYDNLSDFASHYRTGDNSNLVSNLCFVNDSMNDIKGKINVSDQLNYSKTDSSESAVVGAMYDAVDYYTSVNSKLYANLSAEADAVYTIANAIFQMDQTAALVSETALTDDIKGLYSTSNPTVAAGLDQLKTATSNLVEVAKSAVNVEKYDSLSTILGTNLESGGAGKVSVNSINTAIASIVPVLENEAATAEALKSSVNSFMEGIGASNILEGGVWDDVKTNMEAYDNLLKCSVAASEYIEECLKTAMGVIKDYLESDPTLEEADDGKLPELNTQLEQVKTDIENLKNQITAMEEATECKSWDEKGGCTSVGPKYTEADIAPYRESLEQKEQEKQELEKLIAKLEKLAEVLNTAQKIINDAISNVKEVFADPTSIIEGNSDFASKFNLDYSAYGLDDSKDYAKLVDDYYESIRPKDPEVDTTGLTDPTAGTTTGDDYSGGGGGGGGGGGDAGTGGTTEPTTALPTTTVPTPTVTVTLPTTTLPTATVSPTPSTPEEDDSDARAAAEAAARAATTVTPTNPISDDDEAIRKAAEEAARRAGITGSTGSTGGAVVTQATGGDGAIVTTTGDNTTKLGTSGSRSGGGGSYSGSRPSYPTSFDESIEDSVLTEPSVDEPIVDIPTIDDYAEPSVNKPYVEPAVVPETPATPAKKDNKTIRTLGIAAGVGAAATAAALGAYTIVKNKEEKDEDENLDYDK